VGKDKALLNEQTLKNEGIFCEFEFVGVRGYGRVQIRKKQVTLTPQPDKAVLVLKPYF